MANQSEASESIAVQAKAIWKIQRTDMRMAVGKS